MDSKDGSMGLAGDDKLLGSTIGSGIGLGIKEFRVGLKRILPSLTLISTELQFGKLTVSHSHLN